MAEGKFIKVGGVIKEVQSEWANIDGVIKEINTNVIKVDGSIKAIDVGNRILYVCEQASDRLYGYDDEGSELWYQSGATITDPQDVACDASGNSYWACDTNVLKLDEEGAVTWTFTGHTVSVTAICVDADGYVYSGDFGGTLKKLDPSTGAELETMSVGTNQTINALAVDYSEGMLYVGCLKLSYYALYRVVLATFSKVNVPLSFATYGSVYGLAIDESGDLYVGTANGYLMKLNSSGYVYWGNSGPLTSEVRTVRIGHDGYGYCVYGSGRSVRKFDSDGNEEWTETPTGTASTLGCAVDLSGHVYTTHQVAGSSTYNLIRKWSSAGVEMTSWRPYLIAQMPQIAVRPGYRAAGF